MKNNLLLLKILLICICPFILLKSALADEKKLILNF